MFEATEAYRIEDGKLGAPLVGATLIGNGPEVLTRIDRVERELGDDIRAMEGKRKIMLDEAVRREGAG